MSYAHEEVAEVVLSFREALEDLQRNDQYEIENLTMIAKEATEHAQAISQEVETHIRKTRPEYKLPALYLLDSLVKHIGTPYTVYLSRNLYRVFFDAYTVVDNNTRRSMDDLFRSWTQPVPESRDPRPVFPLEVTSPIESALTKMRGIDQRSREAAEASRMQKMYQMPPHLGALQQQPGRTPTPNGQLAYQPPPPRTQQQGHPSVQNGSYQHQSTPSYPPAIRSPVIHTIRSPVQQGDMSFPQYASPPQGTGSQVQYVYSGPPPPSMSHQARLDKLRSDTQGLLDSCRAHIAMNPTDPGKQSMLQNLHSLKALIDQGTLSLTHIQSTETVIANLARQLPPLPPPSAFQPPPSQTPFNPNAIASILARSTPQQTTSQSAIPQQIPYPPPPPVSARPFSSAFPPPPVPPSIPHGMPPASMAQIMSMFSTATPPVAQSTPVSAPAAPAPSFLDQLRASGLLPATPVPSTSVQPPAAASILSQLMQPQAAATSSVKLEAASLKIYRPDVIRQLYESKKDQCRMCGMRFAETEQGKVAKGIHIDWHFKVNTRVQESMKNAVNRSWYIDEHDWISYREDLSGYSGVITETATGRLGGGKKEPKKQFVFVPTDARLVNLPCSICQEKFEQGIDVATQQPIWLDAVKTQDGKYYHAHCWEDLQRYNASTHEVVAARARVGTPSARNTPDPVLGKRRFDDFTVDAAAS